MKRYKVGFIGTGNIATAIFGGIVNSGYIKTENVCVFDTSVEKTIPFCSLGAVAVLDAKTVVAQSEFVFLTIKPQVYDLVLNEIKVATHADTCLVDVAAGISIAYVKSIVGADVSVIRVMPNTPLMYGVGSSALVKEAPTTDEQFNFIRGCFDSCGISVTVDEKYINTVTAISGSAPAYVMRIMKDFIDFAVSEGINAEDAKMLVTKAFAGSSVMVEKDDRSISELISAVTSPNGTTQAGLISLDSDNFDRAVSNCLAATVKRAQELSK